MKHYLIWSAVFIGSIILLAMIGLFGIDLNPIIEYILLTICLVGALMATIVLWVGKNKREKHENEGRRIYAKWKQLKWTALSFRLKSLFIIVLVCIISLLYFFSSIIKTHGDIVITLGFFLALLYFLFSVQKYKCDKTRMIIIIFICLILIWRFWDEIIRCVHMLMHRFG